MKLPRFSLRELFLLVVIAAMGCGWWVERQKARRTYQLERMRLLDRIVIQDEDESKLSLTP